MSNYLHAVVYIDASTTLAFLSEDVARRWFRLTPAQLDGRVDEAARAACASTPASNTEWLSVQRERPGSLSCHALSE